MILNGFKIIFKKFLKNISGLWKSLRISKNKKQKVNIMLEMNMRYKDKSLVKRLILKEKISFYGLYLILISFTIHYGIKKLKGFIWKLRK